ncbi:structural protein VP4 [Sulfolobus polyhedral virus 1]|uniref:Capsid protein VP4 n=1 Tax=Sulfolobus polyhedral virus 1 TaxID=1982658 RepID=CAPS1_SPV1|nr:structural protein VP4 [Sulfolobus polyhedral virus 1]A0A1W6I187.1 RecName: Full=Capsid protein VP4 [Sulfolobus polyhedral virus 1]6OJ0_A Chain A, Structural protein VP4 [Sulfolobus polyhedral virus 1]6OJ0_B Chain B, Structural protein VP4 [Sulfolobus polyhedral virus 1]6OJ0_C Chain C, Structural protein VP4 [Sulfolobus polyhedral virus 1]6OJ0_D Chain D, Structural protein VP4 [Sulfolobus polyhedral virus 1]6OJ0_E Chain E, Structural protein VP4 [Sulfolobus polyhedral virus 1]6OJ0_F Chain
MSESVTQQVFNFAVTKSQPFGGYVYSTNLTASTSSAVTSTQLTPLNLSITLGQITLSGNSLVIPATQIWYLTDAYVSVPDYTNITNGAEADGVILIYKDGVKLMLTTPLISSMSISNPARTHLAQAVKYSPQSILTMYFNPTKPATASTSYPNTVYFTVVVVDFSYAQNPARAVVSANAVM